MKVQNNLKRCPPKSGCGKSYPATPEYFYRDRSIKSGLSLFCKSCKNQRTKDYNRRHPIRKRNLHGTLIKLSPPRYDNLIRLMLEIAKGKFDEADKAAKWLGMEPKTFHLLLLKFRVPIEGGKEKCVHEITRETCHFCRGGK